MNCSVFLSMLIWFWYTFVNLFIILNKKELIIIGYVFLVIIFLVSYIKNFLHSFSKFDVNFLCMYYFITGIYLLLFIGNSQSIKKYIGLLIIHLILISLYVLYNCKQKK